MNYYNDSCPKICAWVRELISAGLVPDGEVDGRSIADVQPGDLKGFTQCHFFCGILGWPLGLALAGWPEDRPCWSMSFPCQPFSQAGLGKGISDERHLFPVAFALIQACQPPVIFGEQVASTEVVGSQLEAAFIVAVQAGQIARANKLAKQLIAQKGFSYTPRWVDGIRSDLEGEGYAFRHTVLGAHSVNAPHLRQRLYWLAESESEQHDRRRNARGGRGEFANGGRLVQPVIPRLEGYPWYGYDRDESGRLRAQEIGSAAPSSRPRRLVLANSDRREEGSEAASPSRHGSAADSANFWSDSYWIECRDGKRRRVPVEPEIFPMASRLPYKLARRRSASAAIISGSGNSIVPQVAAQFIRAYLES